MRANVEGRNLGQLETNGGLVRWPTRDMEVGDTFTVDPEDRSIGQVQAYLYKEGRRLKRKFSVREEGEEIVVRRMPDDADLRSAQARPACNLVGGDDGDYLGVLQPPETGQHWTWPISQMQPGQKFHVRHLDRDPERVRMVVSQLAMRESMPLSFRKNDPLKPGHALVTYRVDAEHKTVDRCQDIKPIQMMIQACYGIDIMAFPLFWEGSLRKIMVPAPRKETPPQTRWVMPGPGIEDMDFDLREDGIYIQPAPPGSTSSELETKALLD